MPFQVTRGSPSAAGASTEAKHALICLRDVSRVLHVARATKFLHRDGKDLVIIPFIQSSLAADLSTLNQLLTGTTKI